MNEVDRHDLEALTALMNAKFDGIERTLHEMAKALEVLAIDRAQKDAALNEVRVRFVDRVTFEQYRDTQDKALDTALEAQTKALAAALLAVNSKLDPLVAFRAKAFGFGTLGAVIAGVAGALIQKAVGG